MSYPNEYQNHDHLGSDDPTELIHPYRRGSRRWLVTGGIAVAVLVFLAGAVVACGGADDRDPTAGPTIAGASPSATVTGSPGNGTPDAGTGGGGANAGGGGNNNGGNNGGGGGGNPGDPGDPPGDPEPPPPGPLQISAAVHGPTPSAGCAASGSITVDGGEYPIEVTHMWFRMQPMGGGLPAHPVPFGGQQTSTVAGPGQLSVQSPAFPADAGQNQVQLRVLAPEAAATGFVAYPQCAELGFSN